MMPPTSLRFDEVLVRLRSRRAERATEGAQAYDALLYANIALPFVPRSREAPRGEPLELGGLRFVGTESLRVRWGRYDEYLRWFHEGEKGPYIMRERLLETMTDGLQQLFEHGVPAPRPLRVWWSSGSPELEELPWELVASAWSRMPPYSLVRGTPGEVAPLVPLRGSLRLGVLGDLAAAGPELGALLRAPAESVAAEVVEGPLPEALRTAASRGLELVHVVAAGDVRFGGSDLVVGEERMSACDLASTLQGSRVTVVAVSPPEWTRGEEGGGEGAAPLSFRAYTHLGPSGPGPSIVAPVGPCPALRAVQFWSRFYATLASRLSVEEALLAARAADPLAPAALFLGHRLGVEFTRRSPSAVAEPTRLSAELASSSRFLEELRALDARVGDLRGIDTEKVMANQRAVHERLEFSLDPWRKAD